MRIRLVRFAASNLYNEGDKMPVCVQGGCPERVATGYYADHQR